MQRAVHSQLFLDLLVSELANQPMPTHHLHNLKNTHHGMVCVTEDPQLQRREIWAEFSKAKYIHVYLSVTETPTSNLSTVNTQWLKSILRLTVLFFWKVWPGHGYRYYDISELENNLGLVQVMVTWCSSFHRGDFPISQSLSKLGVFLGW